jgi:non-heme Fe2+,alpha-ketoglutarate-dependent halogenase
MSTPLSPDDIEGYWKRGYAHRVPVLSQEEVIHYLDRLNALQAAEVERQGGTWWPRDYRPWDHPDHPFADWLSELARHPKILDAVEGILGPNILVRNADIFVKIPGVSRGIGWHVDTAEQGSDTDCMLTAWIGLTESTQRNGCLQFSAGSHRQEIPDGPKDKHTLTLTKTAVKSLNPAATVLNLMDPGMMSMHHFRMVHRSMNNYTDIPRVGFVVRYMSTAISQATAESGRATLVRGSDSYGNLALKDSFPMSWSQ